MREVNTGGLFYFHLAPVVLASAEGFVAQTNAENSLRAGSTYDMRPPVTEFVYCILCLKSVLKQELLNNAEGLLSFEFSCSTF